METNNPSGFIPEGFKLQMILRSPDYYDVEGNLCINPEWIEWEDVKPDFIVDPIMGDTRVCEHTFTCCIECADSWILDWMFRVVLA